MQRLAAVASRVQQACPNALRDALASLDGIRNIDAIIQTYANLSPVDVKGRDAPLYFAEDVAIARRLPGGARRALLQLHE